MTAAPKPLFSRLADKNLHTWLGGWAAHLARRALRRRPSGPRHLVFALCDHFEPLWKGAPPARGLERNESED